MTTAAEIHRLKLTLKERDEEIRELKREVGHSFIKGLKKAIEIAVKQEDYFARNISDVGENDQARGACDRITSEILSTIREVGK